MARYEFKLPDIGEGIAEAEIVAWHIKVGDRIEEDQQIADMMTDKATVEMESPVSGTVVELAGEVGDQVPIGSVLVVIDTDSAAASEQDGSETNATGERIDDVPMADGAVAPTAAMEEQLPTTDVEQARPKAPFVSSEVETRLFYVPRLRSGRAVSSSPRGAHIPGCKYRRRCACPSQCVGGP